jgi:hypothetical protein
MSEKIATYYVPIGTEFSMNKGDNLPGNSKMKIWIKRRIYIKALMKTRSNAFPVRGDALSVKAGRAGVIRE